MNEIRVLPQLTIVKASAGSGKTYFLTKTYVELLLSDSINYNDLRNILAITFSNNASIEIKEKIIKWLKDIYYGKNEAVREFSHLNISTDEIIKKAENIIDKILNNYSEFQVRTIDSFLTKIFKAEAVSFGYYGDFQILSRIDRFLHRSFEIFLNQLNESSELIDYIKKLIKLIEETLPADSTYLWNPTLRIFKMLKNLYSVVSKSNESFIENNIYEKIKLYLNEFEQAKDKLTEIANELYRAIQTHEKGFHKGSRLPKILEKIRNKDYSEILNASCQSLPLTKPSQEIKKLWESFKKAEATFLKYYSKTYCIPYLLIFISFYETLWKLKIREQKIFIDDINSLIRDRIDYLSIPEVYLKLGERIYHYLTDEFQDTSPVQWQNLKALIENSLSEGGSLLLVGDTKQAVYGFRGADYTIMADMISEANKPNHFPSVKAYKILNLYNNFRSGEKIIDFVKDFFQKKLKEYLQEESDKKHLFNKDKIPLPLRLSGLYECQQQVREDLKGIGFVKIEKIEYQEEKENTQKEALIRIIEKLKNKHGFSNRDIAILAFKNSTLNQLSSWLNERGIDFISYSSLDIRNRKIVTELVCFLSFLNSPSDDFFFSVFLLGEIAKKTLNSWNLDKEKFLFSSFIESNTTSSKPYYIRFKENFPTVWHTYFEELLKKTEYLPLYDLVCEIYGRFNLFEAFPEEQGALIKFLEIIHSFEENGGLKKFIEFYKTSGDEDETFWDTSKPFGKDVITLMTVHKAKGLEFPAVLLWMDMDTVKLDKIIFHEGEFLRLPSEKNLSNPYCEDLRSLREDFFNKSFTEELNKLYVAFTRAKEVLYIAIPCKAQKNPTNKPCLQKNDAVKCLFSINTPEESYIKKFNDENNKHETISLKIRDYLSDKAFLQEKYSLNEKSINIQEIKKGNLLHKIISSIIYIDYYNEETLKRQIKEKNEKLNFELKLFLDNKETLNTLMEILNNFKLKQYFISRENREVFTEKEIVDSEGNLYRIDRVVIDENNVTVLEFKFGKNVDEQKAISQIRKYLELLREFYPAKTIKGLIYFSSTNTLKTVQI